MGDAAAKDPKSQLSSISYIPAAALKRFAEDLENTSTSNKFLELNRDRVQQFIEKPDNKPSSSRRSPSARSRKTRIAGINSYSFGSPGVDTTSFLHLQSKPEFQSSLGAKSRFGDGDGSFFDRWLTADVVASKQLLDSQGLPVMKFSLNEVQTGFKKHIKDFKEKKERPYNSVYVKPYAERRAERLEREKLEKERAASQSTKTAVEDSETGGEDPAGPHMLLSTAKHENNGLSHDNKLSSPITAVERENYFGAEARQVFFDYFHSLSRQKMNGDLSPTRRKADEKKQTSPRSEATTTLPPLSGRRQFSPQRSPREEFAQKKSPVLAETEEDSSLPTLQKKTRRGVQISEKTETETVSYAALRPHLQTVTQEEKQVLLDHLFSMARAKQQKSNTIGTSSSTRPSSARTVFLKGCVEKGLLPQPGLIIRKELTTRLNISSLGFGDEVAKVLADALDLLPALEVLSIADNNLSDAGLEPIVAKLSQCPQLTSFDVSQNKVDVRTAAQLRNFLSSPQCRLRELVMESANLDDHEACKFVESIATHNTLRSLDLSRNQLGAHEFAVHKDSNNAGYALSELLCSESCSLQSLKIAWNMIRFSAATKLAESMRFNTSLLFLDLSFNKLDDEGAQILGDALYTHPVLQTLKLAHNNVHARAACVLLTGAKWCASLTELDLSDNPIGEEGARSVLSLSISHGHRLKVDISNCSLTLKDSSCWFDARRPRGEYELELGRPYERAVCMELLQMVARNNDLTLSSCALYGADGGAAQEVSLARYEAQLLPTVHASRAAMPSTAASTNTRPLSRLSLAEGDRETEMHMSLSQARTVFEEETSHHAGRGGEGEGEGEGETHAETGSDRPTSVSLSPSFPLSRDPSSSRMRRRSVSHSVPQSPKVGTTSSLSLVDEDMRGDEMQIIREMFRAAASRIFHQFDKDGSLSLDAQEIAHLLEQLGLENAWALVDKLLAIYDADESGQIEENEFVDFLIDVRGKYEKSTQIALMDRFMFDTTACAKGEKPRPFIAPAQGKMVIVVDGLRTTSERTISTSQIQSLLCAGRTVCESSALFGFALDASLWTIDEARAFFKAMVRELGSVPQVLLKLLPRMATPQDVRMLIAFVTNHDFDQIQALKHSLGPLFRILIGIPDGFYQLYLDEQNDRDALLRLFELSNTLCLERQRLRLGDTSERGDWSCFRNATLNGTTLPITQDWMDDLPTKGRVEFDFVTARAVSTSEAEISNLRLFRVLEALGMVEGTKRKRIFTRLEQQHQEGRRTARGAGDREWEIAVNTAHNISEHLLALREAAFVKRTARSHVVTVGKDEELLFTAQRRTLGSSSSFRKALSSRRTGSSLSRVSKSSAAAGSANNGITKSLVTDSLLGESIVAATHEVRAIDMYGQHIRDLLASPQHDPSLLALRVLEALELILAGRFLTCAQLALMVNKLPFGNLSMHDLATFRVELVISLFSRLKDVINFDFVLRELESMEMAMLFYRLGWLNVWNPLKPEGHFCLDLSQREERTMAKMLMTLNFLEKGNNWRFASYHETRQQYRNYRETHSIIDETTTGAQMSMQSKDEFWLPPSSWLVESSFPQKGILTLQYFSGKGMQLENSGANVSIRMALMPVVLARPYEEDIRRQSEYTVEQLEKVLDNKAGVKLSFGRKIE